MWSAKHVVESTEKRLVPLALTVDPDAARVVLPGHELRWSATARELLAEVRRRTGEAREILKISLPYSSLRQVLEVHLHGASRIRRDVAMTPSSLGRYPKPFVYVDSNESSAPDLERTVRKAAELWVDGALSTWAHDCLAEVTALRGCLLRDEGVESRPTETQVVPWHHGRTGVAKAPDRNSFRALADWAARLLAGHELLPGTGAWRRVVSAGGTDAEGVLLSPPRAAWDGGPAFAFFLRLRVATLPFQPQPLLLLQLGKRRFLSSLPKVWNRQRRISGHIWSDRIDDRVFTFDVRRSKGTWEVDEVLEASAEALELKAHAWNPEAIVRGSASSDSATVHLVHSNALRGIPKPSVPSGVPERDKLDLLERVSSLLAQHGCRAMPAPFRVERPRSVPARRVAKVPPETLLWSLAERSEAFDPDVAVEANEVRRVLDKVLRLDLREFAGIEEDPGDWRLKPSVLTNLATENKAAMDRHRPDGVRVVLLVDPVIPQRTRRLAQACLSALLGDASSVPMVPMPTDVSGPKRSLPGAGAKPKERFSLRVQAWRELAQRLANAAPHAACIVLSPMWFDERQHDDSVNKPAGKHALAVHGGATVQYLVPPKPGRQDGTIDLKDFVFRLQAALADVAFAHAGRVDGLVAMVGKAFPVDPPKTVVGFTVVRRNAGRQFYSAKASCFVAAIRVEVATGATSLQFGTADASGALRVSGWKPFFEGLTEVASVTPISLGTGKVDQGRNYRTFVDATMEEILQEDRNPVVLADSSTSAGLWRWLSDQGLDPGNINLGAREHMQDEWTGVRLVRVREGWAPGLPTDVVRRLVDDGGCAGSVRTPTATGGLYRMPGSTAGAHVYLSAADTPVTFKEKKGVSCYRTIPLLEPIKDDNGKRVKDEAGRSLQHVVSWEPAAKRRWMLPDPIEFTVVLTPEGEAADATAHFVHELRSAAGHFNEQTKFPPPLVFARVLREYVAAFGIELAEAAEDDLAAK